LISYLFLFLKKGDEIVIEEFLEGQELSILAFSDGYTIVPLPPAQDHKRIFDGDQVIIPVLPLFPFYLQTFACKLSCNSFFRGLFL
jgi:hypothetical protein